MAPRLGQFSCKFDFGGEPLVDALHPFSRLASRFAARLVVVAVFLATCFVTVTAFGAVVSHADVGELGPPPAEPDIRQTLTDLYNAGHPPDAVIDVQFVGPILVGPPTVHPNPPPDPWCVRCGYPDQGSSPMYPVSVLVSVNTTLGLVSSALPATSFVHSTNVTYNGTACPGDANAQYCPAYFFYRDGQGRWQVT
jgi:hypothetical protein